MRIRLLKDEFLRHSLILFQAAGLINLFRIIYHFFMIRALTAAEYGILNVLAVLYLALVQPADVFETVITKFTSFYSSLNNYNKFKYFIFHISKKIATLSTIILLLLFIFSQKIGNFLKIDSQTLIILLAIIVLVSFFSSIINGILRGYQKFSFFSFYLLFGTLLKLGFGVLLVMLGFGVLGAMSGWVIAKVLALFMGTFLLSKVLFDKHTFIFKQIKSSLKNSRNCIEGNEFLKIYKYFAFGACNSILFVAVTNMDLLLVKHFFYPESTGFYSIAQMVGKIVLFFPAAISTVMFSKTSQAYATGSQGVDIFKKSLLYVALLCGFMILICMIFPAEIIRLISGRYYPQCVPLTKLFAISMGFFALCLVIFTYNLSMHRFKYLFFLLFFLLIETAIIILFHASLIQVLITLTTISILLFFTSLLFTISNIIMQTQNKKY